MKIGLFTDPHYSCKSNISDRRPSLSYNKIKEAMEHFKANNVDLAICLGDLLDDCGSDEQNIEHAKALTQFIKSYGIQFYSLMGNHDYYNFTKEDFEIYTDGSYPPFEIVTENSVLVFLDCNCEDNGKMYSPKNVEWTNSYLQNDQLQRLEKTLNINADKKFYVFSHQNIENEIDKAHIVRNADDIRRVLENAKNVEAVIQGHYHEGHDTVINGIKYHTLPAMCEGEKNFFEIISVD